MKKTQANKRPISITTRIFTILRVALWAAFIYYGIGKLLAGPEMRGQLWWAAMAMFSITKYPVFRGFMAAFAEAIGWLFLVVWLRTRIAGFLTSFTIIVALAFLTHTMGVEWSLPTGQFAWMMALIYLSALFMFRGGGKLSVDKKLWLCLICKRCDRCTLNNK